MRRKITTILVILILLLFYIVIPVKAEGESIAVILSTEQDKIVEGDIIEIDMSLQILDGSDVTDLSANILYDTEVLEPIETDSFEANRDTRWDSGLTVAYNPGVISFYTTRSSYTNVSGKMYVLRFKVLKTVESTNVEIERISTTDSEYNLIWINDYTLTIKETIEDPTPVDPTPTPTDPLYLSSEKYKIGNNDIVNYELGDKYISRVIMATTVKDFIANLDTNGEVKIYTADGQNVAENEYVATGMTLVDTKGDEEIRLKIAVMGDLVGTGRWQTTDLSVMINTLNEEITLQNEFFIAADLDENQNIGPTDLSTLNMMWLEDKYDIGW